MLFNFILLGNKHAIQAKRKNFYEENIKKQGQIVALDSWNT